MVTTIPWSRDAYHGSEQVTVITAKKTPKKHCPAHVCTLCPMKWIDSNDMDYVQ